jgi:putative ABC transport system permease protein
MTVVLAMIGIYNGLVADALAVVKAPQADVWVVEAGTQGAVCRSLEASPPTRATPWPACPAWPRPAAITYQTIEAPMPGHACGFMSSAMSRPSRWAADHRRRARHRHQPFRTGGRPQDRPLPGDTIRLGRNRFTVVGLVEGAMNSGGDPAVYVTLADAMALQTELDPAAAAGAGRARRGGAVKSASVAAVIARWRRARMSIADRDRAAMEASVAADAGRTGRIAAQASVVDKARRRSACFSAILLSVSAVVIALIIYTMTMEKLKQIATLKLIGAPDRTIIGLIVQQALILGASGWASAWR